MSEGEKKNVLLKFYQLMPNFGQLAINLNFKVNEANTKKVYFKPINLFSVVIYAWVG